MRSAGAKLGFDAERVGRGSEARGAPRRAGAAGFRAVLDGFPELVGVLWADPRRRRADRRLRFGYGNPAMLRSFRLPAATRDRYTLLEALPRMRGSRALRAPTCASCDLGEPWVQEITYDTPFGDGYMLGTFVQRTAKLGDGWSSSSPT